MSQTASYLNDPAATLKKLIATREKIRHIGKALGKKPK
jgi:hypothetical protein